MWKRHRGPVKKDPSKVGASVKPSAATAPWTALPVVKVVEGPRSARHLPEKVDYWAPPDEPSDCLAAEFLGSYYGALGVRRPRHLTLGMGRGLPPLRSPRASGTQIDQGRHRARAQSPGPSASGLPAIRFAGLGNGSRRNTRLAGSESACVWVSSRAYSASVRIARFAEFEP